MLAYEPPEKVKTWLAASVLTPYTPYTITDSQRLYAEVEKARENGYAMLEQQMQIGVRGIAVPLKNRRGQLIAALSVSIPMGNESRESALARVLPVMQETAN